MDVKKAILERKTTKVLGDVNKPAKSRDVIDIDELLTLAGSAPFHTACHSIHRTGDLKGIAPWRFYHLNASNCRILLDYINNNDIDSGKIGRMLAVADALIIVTWLPDPSTDNSLLFEPNLTNMEHIAAASSAIQNLLLAATAQDLRSYWSSGGVLREKGFFNLLEIDLNQILLGAVFIFAENAGENEVAEGKLRPFKGDLSQWSRSLSL